MRQRAKAMGCLLALPFIAVMAACSGPPGAHKAAGAGTLTVSWNAPTKNTDGTPLTDVSGYTIHYGTQPGAYTTTTSVEDPSATHTVIHGLQPGVDYFFAVSAHNAAGRESQLSPETHGKARPE